MTRSATVKTTSMSCSVKSTVSVRSRAIDAVSAMSAPRSAGAMPAVGSSSSRSSGSFASAIASSSFLSAPSSARSRPARMLKNVDLPAPFGPMSARISPRARSKLTPSTARTPPNALRTPTTRSSGSGTTVADHAKNSAREGQHEQDQDGAEHELPVLRVPRRHRVEELVDRRPHWRARRRLHAAEQHHHERLHRHRHRQKVGEHAALQERERAAGDAAEEPRDDERRPLVEPDVDPDRLGAPGVVPGGPEREAERRPPDAREEGDPPAAR